MAAGGWGGMGGGAWGSQPKQEDIESTPASAAHSATSAGRGGTGAFHGAYSTNNASYARQDAPPPYSAQPSLPSASGSQRNFGGGAYGNGPGPALASNSMGAPAVDSRDLKAREADLKKREAELAAREKVVKKLETELSKAGIIKRKNWPICFPLVHHDIPGEIPEAKRRVVREGYMAWYGLVWCLSFQLFCASVMLGYKQADQRIASWFLAVIYWLAGIPIAFFMWYRRLYLGAQTDSNFSFIGFFCIFMIHICFCIWASIAIPFSSERWSFSGFATAIQAFDVTTFCGVIYIMGASFWVLESLFSIWVLKDVWYFWQGKGGVAQVKQEAAIAAFKATITKQTASNRV